MTLKSRKKSLIRLCDVNIDKIVKSGEFPRASKGSQYFFDYTNNDDFAPLYVFLPRMSGI